MTHLIVLQDITENRGMIINDVLADYAHKFGDLGGADHGGDGTD
jgi:hypothetical protein